MKSTYKSTFRTIAFIGFLSIAFLLAGGVSLVVGQTNFGRISGTVSDATGAAVPNATVTISNPATNFLRTVTTDGSGFYTVTNIPVGTYAVMVEMQNFKKAIRTGNVINADSRLTVDVALETGQISELVEVTPTSGETVNTTSGEVGKVIDNQQVDNLALNGRNYYQLLSVIPGAVITSDDQIDTNLATNTININGSRGSANNLTVDGGNNLNAGSNASQINNVGVDFIQEVKLETSNFSAEYGRNSGAQINVITKRGTNQYHGSMFEFFRNDRLDARSFFAPDRPALHYNNYGYSFSGPMPFFHFGDGGGPFFTSGKDKFFFFFGQEWKTIHRLASPSNRNLPTTAELGGNFSQRLTNSVSISSCPGSSINLPPGFPCSVGTRYDGFLRDPNISITPESQYLKNPNFPINSIMACGLIRAPGSQTTTNNPAYIPIRTACFTGNMIPNNRITTDGAAIANVYRQMIGLAARYVDSPVANNATFQPAGPSDFRQEILRLDYIFSPKHTVYGRYIHDKNLVIDPFGTFINSQMPTIQSLRQRPGDGIQVVHLWNIKPTLINEGKVNFSWTNQLIPPANDFWSRDTYGFEFSQIFPNGGAYENSIPDTSFSGSGTVANFNGAARSLTALAHDSTISDTLTWVKGNHTMKFGALYNFSKVFQNGRSTYAGNVNFNSNRPNSTGNAFADALLGNYRTYSEFAFDPASHFRFQQYDAFVDDSWKMTRKLSVELGARFQYGTPFYTRENSISNFDPALYDFAHAVAVSSTGVLTIPAGANRFNGLIRAGDGVPESERANVPSWNSPDVLAVPTGAPRGLYKAHPYFMPRVGFAYSPFDDGKTSIRGGFGMYYDRIEGNIIFPLESNPPFVNSASFDNGNLSNIQGGSASALSVFGTIAAIDPNLKTPYSMNFSLGVQRELPWGLFVEANAVGNLGRNLTRNPDINALPLEVLQQYIGKTRPNDNSLRKYLGYTAINQRRSDSTSNYYAMQLYGAKRKGNLLATISYTWSKVLTDASGFNDNPEELEDRHFNYGPATFDRRHVIVATYTYAPRLFGKSSGFLKALFDGYELSGITRFQSGRPFTITAATVSTGTRRADLVPGVDLYLRDDRQWLNPDAFVAAPDERRGTSAVGAVYGPTFMTWDFSVRKKFRFNENMNLRLQMDLFNAFNKTNFANMGTTVTSGGFGVLNSSGPGRSIQLGIKFVF